jgi:hypothetical protein
MLTSIFNEFVNEGTAVFQDDVDALSFAGCRMLHRVTSVNNLSRYQTNIKY